MNSVEQMLRQWVCAIASGEEDLNDPVKIQQSLRVLYERCAFVRNSPRLMKYAG